MTSESTLRHLVRSLLKESSVPGVLASGVSPDLFVESFRKFWGVIRPMAPMGNSAYDDVRRNNLVSAGLSEEQAQSVIDLVAMCTDPSGDSGYNVRTIIKPMFRALGYKEDPANVDRVWKSVEREFGIVNTTFSEYHLVLLVSARTISTDKFSPMSRDSLPRHLEVMRNLGPETLERRLDFMNKMHAFLELKPLDRRTREKLMSMVREGVGGMMQAAEIYRVL